MTRAVVVGAGLAGATTAVQLRRLGFDGDVVLLGDEQHLPYERPPLSKRFLADGGPVDQLLVHPASTYAELDIDVRLGRPAASLDVAQRTVQLTDGGGERYDVCVIATGGVSVTPPIPGIDLPGVHQLRRLDDALELRDDTSTARRVVVVGMGFIGCEVAATLRGRGLDVTMVDRLPGPLWAQVGEQLSKRVRGWHEEHGLALVSDAAVAGIEAGPDGRACAVRLGDGRAVPADAVVVGVGARPATGWLVDAALHLENGAVGVDDHGRTSAEHVYAVGDVAAVWDADAGVHRRVEHFQSALDQGERVAAAIAGRPMGPSRPSWFWSEQYDHVLHYAGDRRDARVVERAEPYAAFYLRGSTLTAVATVDSGREFRRALRLLGTDVDVDRLARAQHPRGDTGPGSAEHEQPAADVARPSSWQHFNGGIA